MLIYKPSIYLFTTKKRPIGNGVVARGAATARMVPRSNPSSNPTSASQTSTADYLLLEGINDMQNTLVTWFQKSRSLRVNSTMTAIKEVPLEGLEKLFAEYEGGKGGQKFTSMILYPYEA